MDVRVGIKPDWTLLTQLALFVVLFVWGIILATDAMAADSNSGESGIAEAQSVAVVAKANTGVTGIATGKLSGMAKSTPITVSDDGDPSTESDPFTGKAKRYVPELACQ